MTLANCVWHWHCLQAMWKKLDPFVVTFRLHAQAYGGSGYWGQAARGSEVTASKHGGFDGDMVWYVHGWINDCPYVGNGLIIPTDELSIIFQRGGYTTNQKIMWFEILSVRKTELHGGWDSPILQIFVFKHGLQTSIGESIGLKSPDAEKRGLFWPETPCCLPRTWFPAKMFP